MNQIKGRMLGAWLLLRRIGHPRKLRSTAEAVRKLLGNRARPSILETRVRLCMAQRWDFRK